MGFFDGLTNKVQETTNKMQKESKLKKSISDNNSKIETNPTQEVATEIEVTYVETVVLLGEYRFGTGSIFSNSYSPKDNKILLNTKTQQVSFYALSTTYNRYVKYDFPIGACMIIYQKNENTD